MLGLGIGLDRLLLAGSELLLSRKSGGGQTGEAGDAVGAFGFEGGVGWVILGG